MVVRATQLVKTTGTALGGSRNLAERPELNQSFASLVYDQSFTHCSRKFATFVLGQGGLAHEVMPGNKTHDDRRNGCRRHRVAGLGHLLLAVHGVWMDLGMKGFARTWPAVSGEPTRPGFDILFRWPCLSPTSSERQNRQQLKTAQAGYDGSIAIDDSFPFLK